MGRDWEWNVKFHYLTPLLDADCSQAQPSTGFTATHSLWSHSLCLLDVFSTKKRIPKNLLKRERERERVSQKSDKWVESKEFSTTARYLSFSLLSHIFKWNHIQFTFFILSFYHFRISFMYLNWLCIRCESVMCITSDIFQGHKICTLCEYMYITNIQLVLQ